MGAQSLPIILLYKQENFPVEVSSCTTFGQLKEIAEAKLQGRIPAKYIRLMFRGRERQDLDHIYQAGIKRGMPVNIVEAPAFKKMVSDKLEADRIEELTRQREAEAAAQAAQAAQSAVVLQSQQLRGFASDVQALEAEAEELLGVKATGKSAAQLIELLTQNMLKLDGVDTHGDPQVRAERKRLVQLCEDIIRRLEGA